MKFLIPLLLTFTLALGNDDVIHQSLKSMSFDETKNVFVTMNGGNDKVIDEINSQEFATREDKILALNKAVLINSAASQGPAIKYLNSMAMSFDSHAYTNDIYVRNANLATIHALSNMENVEEIREEQFFQLSTPSMTFDIFTKQQEPQWGVKAIKAPECWAMGFTGNGTIAAIVDTGIRYTHNNLKDNFLNTPASWLDPITNKPTPYDDHGHGTHVTGTVCGKNGIGVAPDTKFIGCKGCNKDGCSQNGLTTCLNWCNCPYAPKDKSKKCDPKSVPNVVNNSWGGSGGSTSYNTAIKAMASNGIVPVFAVGNSGSSCSTLGSPGDQPNLIGVAATTEKGRVARFSSRGPSKGNKNHKPDVAAPGEKIISASFKNDKDLGPMSGTSMASPHVTGAVAILCSYKKIDYNSAWKYLTENVDPTTSVTNVKCGGKSDADYPNYMVGYGIINVQKALNAMMQ